ncbi:hypothetical protein LINGRAHAP2_LOCUS16035 [Linum grandiflorum]
MRWCGVLVPDQLLPCRSGLRRRRRHVLVRMC